MSAQARHVARVAQPLVRKQLDQAFEALVQNRPSFLDSVSNMYEDVELSQELPSQLRQESEQTIVNHYMDRSCTLLQDPGNMNQVHALYQITRTTLQSMGGENVNTNSLIDPALSENLSIIPNGEQDQSFFSQSNTLFDNGKEITHAHQQQTSQSLKDKLVKLVDDWFIRRNKSFMLGCMTGGMILTIYSKALIVRLTGFKGLFSWIRSNPSRFGLAGAIAVGGFVFFYWVYKKYWAKDSKRKRRIR